MGIETIGASVELCIVNADGLCCPLACIMEILSLQCLLFLFEIFAHLTNKLSLYKQKCHSLYTANCDAAYVSSENCIRAGGYLSHK